MLMKNKQTMQVKKFLSIGAKWSVQRAQTRERGPPSAPAEVINNSSLTNFYLFRDKNRDFQNRPQNCVIRTISKLIKLNLSEI